MHTMESINYLIIGGGVAGMTAAQTIRQHDEQGRIVVVNRESEYLYSRPSLAAFLKGECRLDDLYLRSQEFLAKNRIEVQLGTAAVEWQGIDRIIKTSNGQSLAYEKLLFAVGGQPKAWKVAGSSLNGVHSLRTIADAKRLAGNLKKARHVVVVGSGFVSLELIQLLSKVGVATTIVVRGDHYWQQSLDAEGGLLLDSFLKKVPNASVLYNTRVDAVAGDDKVSSVILSNGRKLATDLVLVNTGLEYETDWLNEKLTIERGIVVNEYLETGVDGVYAAGDIAVFYDPIAGLYHQLGNWNNATLQGQIAGQNMTGHRHPMSAVTSYSINFLGRNISFIGQTSLRPSITGVPRGSARSGSYGKILIKNNRVIGASLINRFHEREPISRLISSQMHIGQHISELADESVPLAELVKKLGA